MSSSESRKRTRVLNLRCFPGEGTEIQARAQDAGLTTSEFLRCSALSRRIRNQTDRNVVNELRRLGGLQKHLFTESGGIFNEEYAAVLDEIKAAIKRLSPCIEEADDAG